jgi:hypothetical protein
MIDKWKSKSRELPQMSKVVSKDDWIGFSVYRKSMYDTTIIISSAFFALYISLIVNNHITTDKDILVEISFVASLIFLDILKLFTAVFRKGSQLQASHFKMQLTNQDISLLYDEILEHGCCT